MARSEVLTVVLQKIQVFRDMMLHWLENSYQHFGEACCLQLQGNPGIVKQMNPRNI
jgi:hypothetical protein